MVAPLADHFDLRRPFRFLLQLKLSDGLLQLANIVECKFSRLG
jgi:hypothetical protein